MMKRLAFLSVVIVPVLVAVVGSSAATAATTVNCGNSDNLQAAIDAAKPGATLNIAGVCVGTFTTTGRVNLHGITASAALAGPTTIASGPVLFVLEGSTVTVSNLTVRDGNQGGIANVGRLTLVSVTVAGNSVDGGVHNAAGPFSGPSDGTVSIVDSTIENNTAIDPGGAGIFNAGSGGKTATVNLIHSTVTGNTALANPDVGPAAGGGILNETGGPQLSNAVIVISDSQISDNQSFGGSGGGGINNDGGSVDMKDSLISGNITDGEGGGIFAHASVTLSSTTVQGNQAYDGGGISIFNSVDPRASTVTLLNHTTITGNAATDDGGGVFNCGGILNVRSNSTVISNTPNDTSSC